MAVRRKGKEPSDVIIRKFNREVQISGILTDVKKRRYHFKDVSRKLKRQAAKRKYARKIEKRGY